MAIKKSKTAWTLEPDGSLKDDEYGFTPIEIVTPWISGENALDTLRTKNRALGIFGRKISQGVANKINDAVTRTKASITRNIPPSVLEAFRDTESVVYSVQLHECWPKTINVMPLGYDAIGVSRLSVTFTYRHWTSSVKPANTLDANISQTLNSGVSSAVKSVRDKMFPKKQENNTP
jgi:hypothetical protein